MSTNQELTPPPLKAQNPVWSISQITQLIKKRLESFFYNISIQGEISNFKKHSSGHLYFSLKDKNAQITAVMFQGNARSLAKLPKDGDEVIAKGEINVYPPRGQYQIVIRELQFAGVGALLLKFEQLKTKLRNSGYFEKKQSIPKLPKKIGIVTSPTGAAIQDIINVLNRRFSGVNLIINPVHVQGEVASVEIAQAIDQFNQHNLADVLIIGRGGGSIEDLWAFNTEIVAKAIYNSKIPIISAVGHETDFTIADFVADVRAPTPSAAAELVIAEKTKELQTLHQIKIRLGQTIGNMIVRHKQNLASIVKSPLLTTPYITLGRHMQMLDEIKQKIEYTKNQNMESAKSKLITIRKQVYNLRPERQIQYFREKISRMQKELFLRLQSKIDKNKERLRFIGENLQSINPKHLLSKGYSILCLTDGNLLTSTKQIAKDQELRATLSDGEFTSIVKDLEINK